MAMTVALYAGSFDPVTDGHLDTLQAALRLADKVVVAIGTHAGKQPLFSFAERVALLKNSGAERFGADNARLDYVSFGGLVVDAARDCGATMMIRGLRDATDFDYEMQMTGMNAHLAPQIQTVFLPATPATRFITATLVRQIASMGGDVRSFVPETVASALRNKFKPE